MPTIPKAQAHQVPRLGETPAEARRRMQSSGGAAEPQAPLGEKVDGPPTPQHMAAMREQEGFGGGPPEDATVEDAPELAEPPTPSKAMEVIQQLSQEKNQLSTELDAALAKIGRYESRFGEID